MSLGVSGISSNRSYIDTQAINDVAKQIFANSDAKVQSFDVTQADLSKFKRPEAGLDLYSNRNSIEATKQVAIRNAGLDINLNQNFVANVQYLNTQAASQVTKNVEGKLAAPVAEGESSPAREVVALPKSTEVFKSGNLEKDKRGSNPFSFYAADTQQQQEGKEVRKVDFNIFA